MTTLHATGPSTPTAAGTGGTVVIPRHACWWPITGASSLLIESNTGELYRVPDTHDIVPRDYDHALSIPPDIQRAIVGGDDKAWPATIDPKCIVIVRTRRVSLAEPSSGSTYWFVRLGGTPQILRRVPPSVRSRVRTSLLQCATFTQSTLITEYMDTGAELRPELMPWTRYDGHGTPFVPAPGHSRSSKSSKSSKSSMSSMSSAPPPLLSPHTVCSICLTNPPRRVFIPCGHAVLCAACGAARLWRHCPICRAYVHHVNPLFPS